MKKTTIRILIGTLAVASVAAFSAGCGGSGTTNGAPTTAATGGGGTTSGSQVLPVSKNPISNKSTVPGLAVTKALVENNVSADTGKPVDDHLEIAIMNGTNRKLADFVVYYTVSDPSQGTSEGYFTKLAGFTVAPGATRVAHFDNSGDPDHYPINEFGLFTTDKNALVVAGVVSSPGVKPADFKVNKDSGGAEAGVE
ncbi:MAG: hypothetical protein IPK93_09140 [Solirubrobacterales bacterium]|nr:hypothetical protein [Solirubrobacterales bacterium]